MTKLVRNSAEYLTAALVYLAAAAAFYKSELFGDAIFPVDLPDFDYPRFFFLAKWMHRHVLPMWDPHVGFGIPLAGIMESQLFYPPLYLAVWLGGATPGIRVVEWITVSHVALAAVGAYALCRALLLPRPAAFIAGLLFAFGGFFALRVFNCGWVETAAWFPFELAAWIHLLRTQRLRYLIYAAAFFLLMMFAGFWQQVMYSMYFLLFWAAWETVRRVRSKQRTRLILFPIATATVICGAALLCDTCELLPTYAFAKNTARQKLTLEESAAGGLRASDIPAILWAGEFIGNDGAKLWAARRLNSGIRDYYPGTITLVLLACGLWLFIKRRGGDQLFFWVALVLSAAASFGSVTPVFWILYKLAPGFSFFRRSGSLYYFPVLAAAVLSAYTVDHFLNATPVFPFRKASRNLMLLGLILLALFFVSHGKLESRGALLYFAAMEIVALVLFGIARYPARASFFVYLLAGACFADLAYFHSRQFAFVLPSFDHPKVSGIREAENVSKDVYRLALAPLGGNWDNFGEIAGFENPGGYLLFRQKRYQHYMEQISGPNSPLLALANARFWLTTPTLMRDGLRRVTPSATENRVELPSGLPITPPYALNNDVDGLKLYKNSVAMPRYYFSSSASVIAAEQKQLALMSDPNFARRRSTVLEIAPPEPVADCGSDPVSVLTYTPNHIALSARAHASCLLVETDSYHPEWNTYIDGRRATTYSANSVFRAALVPTGEHSVELRFEPVTLWIGMAISSASALTLLACFFVFHRRVEAYLEQ